MIFRKFTRYTYVKLFIFTATFTCIYLYFKGLLRGSKLYLLPLSATFCHFFAIIASKTKEIHLISDAQGHIPDNEEAAELLYQNAYQQVKAFYQPAVGGTVLAQETSLRANFLLTQAPIPYYNSKAVAMRI